MKRAIAQSTSELECSNCGCEANSCNACNSSFDDEEDIYCSDDDYFEHYHENCKPKKIKSKTLKRGKEKVQK